MTQIRILSVWLVVFSVLEFLWLLVKFLTKRSLVHCADNSYWDPASEGGALFLLLLDFVIMAPTVVIWYAFYWLPKKNNRVSFATQKIRLESRQLLNTEEIHIERFLDDESKMTASQITPASVPDFRFTEDGLQRRDNSTNEGAPGVGGDRSPFHSVITGGEGSRYSNVILNRSPGLSRR